MSDEQYALITKAPLLQMVGTSTPEKSLEDGENTKSYIVDNYDKAGTFDLSKLNIDVLRSGFSVFDKHFVIKKGVPQIVTIAGYTSHGKSAMLMQLAYNIAKLNDLPVLVHSFEMGKVELETRILAMHSQYPAEKIMRGEIPERRVEQARISFSNIPVFLSKSTDNTIPYVQGSAYEKAKEGTKIGAIIIDYIQIMQSSIERQSRTREIADCMRGLKTLSEKLECPILIGSQMNRECEKRGKAVQLKKGIGEYRPVISDIAESSVIAHDSDVVLFVTRQEQYDGTRIGEADILCAKNRSGQTFETTMRWSGEFTSFYEEEKVGL